MSLSAIRAKTSKRQFERNRFEGDAVFVGQKEQLGTGDAVNAAREYLEKRDSTLIVLSGDVPMIRAETLAGLVQHHRSHRGKGAACTF